MGARKSYFSVKRAMAAAEFPALRLERGAEVALDTPAPDLSDPRVRLAGTPFTLVEFPFMTIPPNAAHALFEVKVRDVRTSSVKSKPKRRGVSAGRTRSWKKAIVQVGEGDTIPIFQGLEGSE